MNNRVLTLSLLMAVLAVFFVQSYVSSIEEEAKKKFGTEVLVLAAKRDVKEMETLNETVFELKLIPKRFLEPAAVSWEKREEDKDTARDLKKMAGAIAMVPIKKGEQITYNKITEPGMRTGLAPQIAPGRRAFPIPVTDMTSVAKLVKPGDRVDVIAIVDAGGGKENKIAKMILQDVAILAVGRHVTNHAPRTIEQDPFTGKEKVRSLVEYDGFTTVTLEVEPAQAQALALMVANGDNALSLMLRNNDDSERVNLGATTLNDVLGTDAGRVVRTPAGRR